MTNYVILLRNNNFSRLPNKIDHFRRSAGVRRLFLFILPFPHTPHPTPHTPHPTPHFPITPLPHHPTPHTPHPTPYTLFQVSGQEITAF
ncbi:MAG: hypothetical protein O9295_16550 [Microcystis sp. LE18-22.4A]|nr:hypothetical protein [Microcystis sp. LE18-22.4A]